MDIVPLAMNRDGFLPIDYHHPLCHTAAMSQLSRKFVAVLMLLWLPLSSGSALAATVSMQLAQGHEATSQAMSDMDMSMDMDEHCHEMPATDEHGPSCSSCGVCHLACTGYLAVPAVAMVAVQSAAREDTPYLVSFRSYTSAPLVPPPLARA